MNICVYGAASSLIDKSFIEAGEALGEEMAKRGHRLVFGGGSSGLMGAVARGVYSQNGYIIGVAPSFFDVDGVLFEHCDEMIKTVTMRERKQVLEDMADAFIVSPGGIGTFDEFFEILTLKQLGRHNKPIVILNTDNYYGKMAEFLENAVDGRFLTKESKLLYEVTDDPRAVLDYIENYNIRQMSITELKNI